MFLLKMVFPDRPTDPEDFYDKFNNNILEKVFIINGLSYRNGWKICLEFKCSF
jgi:hypothetical protein